MKKILMALGILLCPTIASADFFGFLDRSATRDTVSIPIKITDSVGNPVVLASGDSVYITVFAPGGAVVFVDSMPFDDASINTYAWEDFAGRDYVYTERVSILDGASTAVGMFTLFAHTQNLTSAALEDQKSTSFYIGDNLWNALLANLDATISSRLAPTTASRTLDVTATGEAGVDFSNIAGTLDSGEVSDSFLPGAKLATSFYNELATKEELAQITTDSVLNRDTSDVQIAGSIGEFLIDSSGQVSSGDTAIGGDERDLVINALHDTLIYIGEHGLGIFVDSTAGNTNTVIGVDGTEKNPVSTLAAARTLALALGAHRFYIHGGSTFNGATVDLAADYSAWEFYGEGFGIELAFGGQLVTNSFFQNIKLSGAMHASGGDVHYVDCEFGFISANFNGHADNCELLDTIVIKSSSTVSFDHCFSGTTGDNIPTIDLGSGAASLEMNGYGNKLRIMSGSTNDTVSIGMNGDLIISANNTSLTVTVWGVGELDDSGTTSNITRDAFINGNYLTDLTWNEDSTGHYTPPNMAFVASQTSAGGLDSGIVSRVMHRVGWGTPKGSGSDSSTVAERDVSGGGGGSDTTAIKAMMANNRDIVTGRGEALFWGVVNDAGATGGVFIVAGAGSIAPFDLSRSSGYYDNLMIQFVEGNLEGRKQPITDWNTGTNTLTNKGFFAAPGNGDTFMIAPRTFADVYSVSGDIAAADSLEFGLDGGAETNRERLFTNLDEVLSTRSKIGDTAIGGDELRLTVDSLLDSIGFTTDPIGPNLVLNPGFERDSALANTAPEFWTKGAGTHTNDASVTSPYGGRWAFQFDVQALDTSFVYQRMTGINGTPPAGRYYFSADVNNDGLSAPAVGDVYLVIDDVTPTTTSGHLDSLEWAITETGNKAKIVVLTGLEANIYIGLRCGGDIDTSRVVFDNIRLIYLGPTFIFDNDSIIVDQSTLEDLALASRSAVGDTNQFGKTDIVSSGAIITSGGRGQANVVLMANNSVTAAALASDAVQEIWDIAFSAGFAAGSMGDSLNNATYVQGSASSLTATKVSDTVAAKLATDHGAGSWAPGGSGSGSDSIIVYNSTLSAVVPQVSVTMRNLAQTSSVLAKVTTDQNGKAQILLSDSGVITAVQPGLTGILDTVDNDITTLDTLYVTSFNPGAPADNSFSRVYGFIRFTEDSATIGAVVTAELRGGANMRDTLSDVWVVPFTATTLTDTLGYFALDIRKTAFLNQDASYNIKATFNGRRIFMIPGFVVPDVDSVEVVP